MGRKYFGCSSGTSGGTSKIEPLHRAPPPSNSTTAPYAIAASGCKPTSSANAQRYLRYHSAIKSTSIGPRSAAPRFSATNPSKNGDNSEQGSGPQPNATYSKGPRGVQSACGHPPASPPWVTLSRSNSDYTTEGDAHWPHDVEDPSPSTPTPPAPSTLLPYRPRGPSPPPSADAAASGPDCPPPIPTPAPPGPGHPSYPRLLTRDLSPYKAGPGSSVPHHHHRPVGLQSGGGPRLQGPDSPRGKEDTLRNPVRESRTARVGYCEHVCVPVNCLKVQ